MIHAISVERLMTFGLKAWEVKLVSEARAGDRHSTVTKRETIVVAEVMRIRERQARECFHLRQDESNPICVACGEPAKVWYSDRERWLRHPARCMVEG
jgi:hypothetical protein